jgi:hypothetical protein
LPSIEQLKALARKAAEIKDDVQDVMRLAGRYASPPDLARFLLEGKMIEMPDIRG